MRAQYRPGGGLLAGRAVRATKVLLYPGDIDYYADRLDPAANGGAKF